MKNTINKQKVKDGINAIAKSLDMGYSVDELEVLFDLGCEQMNNSKEVDAFYEGTLAVFARVGNMKITAMVHEAKFAKLMK